MTRKEYLLNKLVQECCEVAQAATKCMEFGTEDLYPLNTNETNEHKMQKELFETIAIMGMLIDEGFVNELSTTEDGPLIMREKVKKVNHWALYSEAKNCLIDDNVTGPTITKNEEI